MMFIIDCTRSPSDAFFLAADFSAGTKLLTTGSDWIKNKSRACIQDGIRCATAPPNEISDPTVSTKTPTSAIGPHCMANPV